MQKKVKVYLVTIDESMYNKTTVYRFSMKSTSRISFTFFNLKRLVCSLLFPVFVFTIVNHSNNLFA